ncbi:6-hydroxy-d-nicotine oxidase [Fusarium pseudocircinatum]|uniref:6-hydroxy-d-nicotine oxidase n=1 Tax=Fusarium pseudocircinatum TaxID=56676 RepID=A0A8H5P4W8_9HYPO|nr:6-hydroxy-d-nicotine oxidase [Fusarium pseudocircinatum]
MDNSCEIPQGKEVSSSQVNDDLPNAEALKIADGSEVLDGKGEKHTFKSIYSGPEKPRRVLVVFVRHFFCCSCVSYTSFLAKSATPEKLQEINTEIVIIGHGDPRTVDMYRIDTGCEFPIYTDPSEELYKTLGMIRTWEEGPPNKYIPISPLLNAWMSMKNAFWKLLEGYPVWNWGTTNQQGGEFLFVGERDDKKVTWCHRMRNSRDHTDTDEILEAAMEFIAAGVSWALSKASSPQKVLGRLGLASLVTQNSWPELSSKLSPQASIVLPDDTSFDGFVSRWRDWHGPRPGAVVRTFSESDVQETIRYANEHGIPFLARSGGHGATEALQLAKDVIVVDLRDQNDVEIANDGKSARIGGGASVKKVVNELWTAGKQTVTGICECVGVSAPVLGGGHGWLQGQYGLASDQVISARVVLPNGDAVTASEDSNTDLFWALRGAGHNFGIVTEWEYRIYDINNSKWSYEIFIFLGDKVEDVLELTNKMMKTQPPYLTHWIYIVNIPEIDPDKPIIWCAVISDGAVQEARDYAKPLHDLGPINVNAGEASMPELAAITLMSDDSVGCAKGFTGLRYPIGLKTYDLFAVRKVFNEIADISKRVPEFAGSFFLLEGYSTHGVKAIDAKKSAFPHRDDEILVTPYILYKPNATLDGLAQEHGEKLRRHLLEASGDPEHLRAYVNYAHGFESLEEMYGHEPWRIEKLKALKKKWDPENRMRFYAPIV